MRIDLKKFLLVGGTQIQGRFFEDIQKLGIIEFIGKKDLIKQMPPEIQNLISANLILRRIPPVKQAPTVNWRSATALAGHIVEISEKLESLREQVRILNEEVARVTPFGDFSIQTLHEIEAKTHRKFQFFFAKQSDRLAAPKRPEVIFLGSYYGLDYFVSINKEHVNYEGLTEIIIERPLGELQTELAEVRRQIDTSETELGTLAHYRKMIKTGLADALNSYHLQDSQEKVDVHLEGAVFSVEAWVPVNKIEDLQKIADRDHVLVDEIQVEEHDKIPTYLENKKFSRLGEDLVGIYDTPSRTDRDPSPWVFWAFGLFFSMIVADAGYGLLLLGISLYLYFKFRPKPGLGSRVLKLTMALSVGCIFWGAMTSSFFGIELNPENPVRKISLINWMVEKKAEYFMEKKPPAYEELVKEYPDLASAQTPKEFLLKGTKEHEGNIKYQIYDTFTNNVLMEIVIMIGAIHIIISFLRYIDRNWAGIGWILFLIGGYLYFPLILKANSIIHYIFGVPMELGASIGLYLLLGGIGVATVLALIQKKWAGLVEPMTVINVFSDVMSYLRIYALSLAGMIMGATFNDIGSRMPIYVGVIIIFLGHTVNFTLALMGGLIHGLRLNFIEWYHYSFEGGGKKFDPLSLIEIH